nr:MAG TPA: hypothetical protein [Caudoviricetes sp.]
MKILFFIAKNHRQEYSIFDIIKIVKYCSI